MRPSPWRHRTISVEHRTPPSFCFPRESERNRRSVSPHANASSLSLVWYGFGWDLTGRRAEKLPVQIDQNKLTSQEGRCELVRAERARGGLQYGWVWSSGRRNGSVLVVTIVKWFFCPHGLSYSGTDKALCVVL